MGKRRSQMRQNAPLQRVAEPPQITEARAASVSALSPVAESVRVPRRDDGAFRASVPSGRGIAQARGQLRDQLDWLEENPVALTLGGIAVGIIAGLLLPVSDAETERLADVGENIAEQVQVHVQAIGQDVVEHGKAVVVETVQAAVLGGQSPVDAVQQSVQDHLATVAQNAQARVEASLGLGSDG